MIDDPLLALIGMTGDGVVDRVDPRFAARLRSLVEAALTPGPTPLVAPVPSVTPVPPADPVSRSTAMSQVITPYLCVHDATAALDWYRRAFGATVSNRIEWEGKVGHSELEVAGAVFYLSDEYPEIGVVSPRTLGAGSSTSMVVLVGAADEFIGRAVAAGATLQRPVEEAHGTRSGWIVDPFGHRWNIGTPLVPAESAADRRRPAEPYYLTITSPDVERAAVFYGAVLDWEFAEPHNGGRHVVNTTMPMGLRPPQNPFSTTEAGEIEMWFTVRDFDASLDRVRAAGGTVLSVTGYDSGREARCHDDQGTLFRVSEPAPGYDTAR